MKIERIAKDLELYTEAKCRQTIGLRHIINTLNSKCVKALLEDK